MLLTQIGSSLPKQHLHVHGIWENSENGCVSKTRDLPPQYSQTIEIMGFQSLIQVQFWGFNLQGTEGVFRDDRRRMCTRRSLKTSGANSFQRAERSMKVWPTSWICRNLFRDTSSFCQIQEMLRLCQVNFEDESRSSYHPLYSGKVRNFWEARVECVETFCQRFFRVSLSWLTAYTSKQDILRVCKKSYSLVRNLVAIQIG